MHGSHPTWGCSNQKRFMGNRKTSRKKSETYIKTWYHLNLTPRDLHNRSINKQNFSVREEMKHWRFFIIDNARNEKFISIMCESLNAYYTKKYLEFFSEYIFGCFFCFIWPPKIFLDLHYVHPQMPQSMRV